MFSRSGKIFAIAQKLQNAVAGVELSQVLIEFIFIALRP
jgi:hypothetical protein